MTTKFSLPSAKTLYKKAVEAYYNSGTPIMTDKEFDRLEAQIKAVEPGWSALKRTGTRAVKKTERELRHFMPSLSKAYPDDLPKWLAKNPNKRYVVMDKLDGNSVQLIGTGDRSAPELVTRGNGEVGGDISFLAKNIRMPSSLAKKVYRTEAIISEQAFKRYAAEFDNARNMVAGLLNRKEPHPALKHVQLVSLGQYGENLLASLKATLTSSPLLRSVWFKVLTQEQVNDTDFMVKLLQERKRKSEFAIDGLVIAPTSFVLDYPTNDKPKNIVAFKVNFDEEAVSCEVKDIIWQVAASGRITPKIQIESTRIGGVSVRAVTAHNAQWMLDRKIGPGAVVTVVRSGGVIPKIVDVTVPSKSISKPSMPHKMLGVHYVVATTKDERITKVRDVKRTARFLKAVGIEFLADKTLAKVYQEIPTVEAFIKAWGKKLLVSKLIAAGMTPAGAAKIQSEFSRVFGKSISGITLAVASQTLSEGIGERKLRMLEKPGVHLPEFLDSYPVIFQRYVAANVKGWGPATVDAFLDTRYYLKVFLKVCKPYLDISWAPIAPRKKASGPLSGKKVSFTGYRDRGEEARIEALGGEVVNFSKSTDILIYKEGGKASGKVAKARDSGIATTSFVGLVNQLGCSR